MNPQKGKEMTSRQKITPLRLAGLPRLHKGKSPNPSDGACIMQYVSLIRYERFNDAPRCVNVVVRRLAISVNDLSRDEERENRLMPLVHRMMDTQGLTSEQRRQLVRWLSAASVEAAEARRKAEEQWRGRRWSSDSFTAACDDEQAVVYYKWLLKVLAQIEAWKHTRPAAVTREEWESWDELRTQYAAGCR
jgi:hypothetical protein